MSTVTDQLAAYAAAVSAQNPTAPIRMALTDAEALELVTEHGTETLRNPDAVAAGAKALSAVLEQTVPTGDALLAYAKAKGAAIAAFWSAFAGESINGVEVIRRPQ